MAHFPPSFLDEVLSRTDLVELIGRHVELKKSGSRLVGLCPFHHEKTPSFSVSPDKQLYYCFGCGKGGGAFQFLMDHDGMSFPEAVEYLAEKAGIPLPEPVSRADEGRTRQGLELLARAAQAYARALAGPEGAPARAYLERRGLPASVVRDYGLGFAPAGYGFLERTFGRDSRLLAGLEAVGLLFRNERGYGDRFRNRLMFPIRDRRGRVVGFGGRVLGEGEPKYLNSPETPWFHKSELLYGLAEHRDAIRRNRRLIVVEGYMDVLALAAAGLPVAVAPLGTAMGERQLRELFRLSEAPVFCFDGDRAGRQAAWRALERMMPLLRAEHAPRFLFLPEGEDPDSLVRREGAEAFSERLEREARPVLETWLSGLGRLAGGDAAARARMAKKADAMLATMQDQYLRQVWRQEIEKATGVRLELARRPQAGVRPESAPEALVARLEPLSELEQRFLAALLEKPERFHRLPATGADFFLDKPAVHRLYTRAFTIVADAEDTNDEIASLLIREFPEFGSQIARWANQASVPEIEFESLMLDMEANLIRRQMNRRGLPLAESVSLQRRLREIAREQRELRQTMHVNEEH